MSEEKIGAIILAAGNSSRLGKPKQLLLYGGETLIHRAALAALDAGCAPVVVVTGNQHAEIHSSLAKVNVQIVQNHGWESGIGSSIRFGLESILQSNPPIQSVLITVCDQLHVTAEILGELIAAKQQSGKPAVASQYSHCLGVPALFDRKLFPMLSELGDQEGAKKIFSSLGEETAFVPFPKGSIDIDTPYDCLVHLS